MPQLRMPGVCAWAITAFARVMEVGDIWLTPEQASEAAELGHLFVRSLVWLARAALVQGRPRYKVRPRLHSYACEVISKLRSGSLMNPKFCACWADEAFIGQVCNIGKAGPIHASTMGLRLLQRLEMNLNAHLAAQR